jgi:hypothetical protein
MSVNIGRNKVFMAETFLECGPTPAFSYFVELAAFLSYQIRIAKLMPPKSGTCGPKEARALGLYFDVA